MRRSINAVFLTVLLARLFLPQAGWGAWASGGAQCNTSEEVSDTTLVCTLAVENAEVGNVMLCVFGIDNTGTADGTSSEIASVTDSSSNTYNFLAAFRNGQGAAAAGAQVEAWYSILGTLLSSGSSTITLTTANTITDKVMQCIEFTIGAGNIITIEGAIQTGASDNADAGSLTISGIVSLEYLFLRGIAPESNAATSMTATASYTLYPGAGCLNTLTGGEASDMGSCGEWRILTATGDTSDPTLVGTTNDNASIYMALKEAAPPATAPQVIVID